MIERMNECMFTRVDMFYANACVYTNVYIRRYVNTSIDVYMCCTSFRSGNETISFLIALILMIFLNVFLLLMFFYAFLSFLYFKLRFRNLGLPIFIGSVKKVISVVLLFCLKEKEYYK